MQPTAVTVEGIDKAEEDSNADTMTGLVSIKGILLEAVSRCEVGRRQDKRGKQKLDAGQRQAAGRIV